MYRSPLLVTLPVGIVACWINSKEAVCPGRRVGALMCTQGIDCGCVEASGGVVAPPASLREGAVHGTRKKTGNGWSGLRMIGAPCFLTWLLLLSGPRSVLVMHRARRRGVSGSDADMLAEVTHLPAPLWVLAFGAFSLWCALRGAVLLVG